MHAISNRCMEATIVNTSKDHKLPNTTEKGKLVASNALETQAPRPERKHTGLARAKSDWGHGPTCRTGRIARAPCGHRRTSEVTLES
jgi:hypothetical protein